MMLNNIISGPAVILAAERAIKGVLIEGWALPGGRFTSDPERAQAEADRNADIMLANAGRQQCKRDIGE